MTQTGVPNLWVTVDPTLAFRDSTLGELVDYWNRKRGERAMPTRADIDPLELKQHLGSLCLIEVSHTPLRLRYRLIGTTVTRTMGRDATGRYYDEIYEPEMLRDILASFQWIVDHKAPLRTFGRAFYPDKNFYEYEIVNLPLSDDGRAVSMVLGKLVFTMTRPG